MIARIAKTREYLDYIEEHYWNVQKAYGVVIVECCDMPFVNDQETRRRLHEEVLTHDLSKLSHEEFIPYRLNFFPSDGEIKKNDLFDSAWKHHKECNTHHYQNWKNDLDIVDIVHNVIDWIAMSYKFDQEVDSYYNNNKHTMGLPDSAIELIEGILRRVKLNA